jgi:beta-glucosidase
MLDDPATAAKTAELTLEEKASLLSGASMWTTQSVEHAGIPSIVLSDGPHGVRRQPIGGDHLGIGHSLPATCFPPAVGLGASWDPELIQTVGEALGLEARSQGVDVLLGPGINIKRSPLCGRNFEYFSEDPHTSGILAAAFVEGVQSQGVGTSLKHFAANNQETDRMRIDAEVDERTLREIYLPAFEYVVKHAHPWTVMCSYNRLNGTHTAQNHWLLTQVLRDEWGYDGLVVSDWGAVADIVASIAAGLDLEMPTSGGLSAADIVAAVQEGRLDEGAVDRAATRLLDLVDRTRSVGQVEVPFDEHHRLAREVAGQCVVLLHNDGVLPLSAGTSFAVIGELARTPRIQGAGSSQVVPTRIDSALSELRALNGSYVPFAPGYRLDDYAVDDVLVAEAVGVAESAPVTVVFLGLPEGAESEGYDRTSIRLPSNQRALIDALAGTDTRLVVVLTNGAVVSTSEWQAGAAAIVEAWLLGQAGGGAIADVLFGATNPAGRLCETIPLRLEDTAAYLNFPGELGRVPYAEGVFVGYRYHDAIDGPVAFPFGHGLSYTTFDYSDLTITSHGNGPDLRVEVSVRVTNSGERSGREVVQLYVGAPSRRVRRPPRELRAFAKPALEPGESTVVQFELGWRDFAYFDTTQHDWTVEPGRAVVHVGASSRDLRLSGEVDLDVAEPTITLTPDSTLADWMSVPAGRHILEREIHPPGTPAEERSRFIDPEYIKTIGSIPLSRLARFPGAKLDHTRLAEFAEEANRD